MKKMDIRIPSLIAVFLTTAFCICQRPSPAFAGDFRVYPIRLDLDRGSKSGALNIVNEGSERLNVQAKLYEWTQDENGKDSYSESNDLIYFPKTLTVQPNEERVLRVGLKTAAVSREGAYRLFVEELPAVKKAGEKGAKVAIAIRFGLPVFVKPVKEDLKGEINDAFVSKGILNVTVSNPGNVNFSITSIKLTGRGLDGKETFSRDVSGWYLLPGAKRLHTTPLESACPAVKTLDIEVRTQDFSLKKEIKVTDGMCGQ